MTTITIRLGIPNEPQMSPFELSRFRILCRYSTAFENCSFVRKMHEIEFIAVIEYGLWRKADSYALIARSKSPISSVKDPINRSELQESAEDAS